MAKATRTEAQEVTDNYTVTRTENLQPGDVVTSSSHLSVQVDRTKTTPGKVTLELSDEEAVYLRTLLGRVVPTDTPSHGIFDALADLFEHAGDYRFVVGDLVSPSIRAERLV